MGIKRLGPFLRKHQCHHTFESLSRYSGKTIAIDTPIFMYRFLAAKKTNWMRGFEQQFQDFAFHRITPIYVFDGRPPALKGEELAKRREVKEGWRAKAADETLPFYKRIEAQERVASFPTSKHYAALQEELKARSIDYRTAEHDGEKLCAKMTQRGEADVVLSQDFDTLVFGGAVMCSSANGAYTEYDLQKVLDTLGFTYKQFVDFAVLCGSDFGKIKHFGPARSKKLITNFQTIEASLQHLLETKIGFSVPDSFRYKEAREEFIGPETLS